MLESCKWNPVFLEMKLEFVIEDTDFNVILLFTGCSKFSFVTSVDDRLKPLKELTKTQIPYFIQDVEITDVQIDGKDILKCNILMPPLNVRVICSTILIDKE